MVKYRVYIEQVNQDVYDIDVPDEFREDVREDFARNEAKEKWLRDYGNPIILSVECAQQSSLAQQLKGGNGSKPKER